MKTRPRLRRIHRHSAVTQHLLVRRDGVPYELERTTCRDCGVLLAEQPVRRAPL